MDRLVPQRRSTLRSITLMHQPNHCRIIYSATEWSSVRMTSWSIKRLFRASNYIEFMWPSFALSQIFGLFPFKITRGILLSSISGYVYAASLLTFLSLTSISLAYRINISQTIQYKSLQALLQSDCYLLLGYLFCATSFLCSDYKLQLFKAMSVTSRRVPKSRWNVTARLTHAKDIAGFLFLMAQLPNTLRGDRWDILVKSITTYITLAIYLLDNQFVNCVLATKLTLESLNSELSTIATKAKAKEVRLPRHDKLNPELLTDIRSMRKNYEDICNVVKITNDAFCLPLIISVALTFAEVTFSLYFYILTSVGAKEINLEKQIWFHYFITSAAYYSSKFLVGVWACENTKDEAQKSKVIVHKILTRINDQELIQEVILNRFVINVALILFLFRPTVTILFYSNGTEKHFLLSSWDSTRRFASERGMPFARNYMYIVTNLHESNEIIQCVFADCRRNFYVPSDINSVFVDGEWMQSRRVTLKNYRGQKYSSYLLLNFFLIGIFSFEYYDSIFMNNKYVPLPFRWNLSRPCKICSENCHWRNTPCLENNRKFNIHDVG